MQRSSVDLPEPEAPISATASCSATVEVDAAQHLALAERLGDAADLEHRRAAHRRASPPPLPMRSTSRASGTVTHR